MPTTTIAKRMYFSKPPRTTGSTTKRRKMASIASRESQASVADKSRASTKEAANKAINIGGLGPKYDFASPDYCAHQWTPQRKSAVCFQSTSFSKHDTVLRKRSRPLLLR